MDFSALLGKTFQEKELYELLLFELEQNFDQNLGQFVHIYFESIENQKIKVVGLCHFNDNVEMNQQSRANIEKKAWFEIEETYGRLRLMLCRLDRTGFMSTVTTNETRTEEWCRGWADEFSGSPPMTPDEIRQAFGELAGALVSHENLRESKSKKTM